MHWITPRFSTDADDVKVISQNKGLTLKGVARSDEESRAVRTKARSSGGGYLRDDLSVRAKTN